VYCCVLIVRIVGLQGYLFSYKVLYSALMKISATRNSYKIFDVLCLSRSYRVEIGNNEKFTMKCVMQILWLNEARLSGGIMFHTCPSFRSFVNGLVKTTF